MNIKTMLINIINIIAYNQSDKNYVIPSECLFFTAKHRLGVTVLPTLTDAGSVRSLSWSLAEMGFESRSTDFKQTTFPHCLSDTPH